MLDWGSTAGNYGNDEERRETTQGDGNTMDTTVVLGHELIALIAEVEAHAYRAWPGLHVETLDGWRLRSAANVTRRANSVWAQQCERGLADPARLTAVERFYAARNLPARYQLCPVSQPGDLDAQLAQRGYRLTAQTAVQIADLDAVWAAAPPLAPGLTTTVEPMPTPVWRELYTLVEDAPPEQIDVRLAIMAQVQAPSAYATVRLDGKPAAIGSAVADGDWLGLFNIGVSPALRRRGAAQAVLAALYKWGAAQGVRRVYLQVMTNNTAALALYARYGFTTLYQYHYREQV